MTARYQRVPNNLDEPESSTFVSAEDRKAKRKEMMKAIDDKLHATLWVGSQEARRGVSQKRVQRARRVDELTAQRVVAPEGALQTVARLDSANEQ